MSEQKQNNNLMYIIAIILLIFIAIWAYFVGKKSTTNNLNENTKNEQVKNAQNIVVYSDLRCKDCQTNAIIEKLKSIPALTNANFIIKDYKKDPEVKDYITKNQINSLPLFIFNTNNIDPSLNQYLNKSPNEDSYFLVWGNFNPIAFDKLEKREETPKTLEVFTMWYCPFGELALKALPQIKEQFKNDDIKINIHYIANKSWTGNTADDFQSLHWVPEAEENIRQLCITKNYWTNKMISYAVERYKNADNYGRINDKPEDAMKAVWIDSKKIEQCITSGEWAKLLEEDIKLAQELWISASPTWFANNKYKFGWIRAGNIQKSFCQYNPDLEGCKTQIKNATTIQGWTPACGK
jgi:protein-disulfide isomerase